MVTQDCLLICSNILSDSETCQRLFYEMGSGWFLRLADFFDPSILEAAISSRGLYDTSDPQDDFAPSAWFDQPSRVMCAKYAAQALANSLSKGNKKYQNMIGVSSSNLLSNAAFWIARRGPLELINPVIELLSHAVAKNDMVRLELTQALLKLSPPKRGKNVHALFDCPPSSFLAFGWKPLPREDLRVVSIPSLLAEQVIFQAPLWSSKYEQSIADTEKTSAACLGLLDTIFSVDSSFASLMLQYVLAPPPPSLEDDDISGKGSTGPIETMKPFVTLVLNTLLEAHARLMSNAKR
jgi:hypothetical protein